MNYGYFDDLNREYVITDPRTPTKWINYIGTLQFGGFVDHTGGALICKDDPTFNRITKYIQQLPSSDFKGETLYLRLHPRAPEEHRDYPGGRCKCRSRPRFVCVRPHKHGSHSAQREAPSHTCPGGRCQGRCVLRESDIICFLRKS